MFTHADFELYQTRFQSDPEWNGRRLEIRRRLQALGEKVCGALKGRGISLDRRESLHHPHHTNGKRVRRQRTMFFRDRKTRRSLQGFLGKELGKDLDSAVNNLHFQAGLEERGFFWGLRFDPGAWYDLNVLLKRAEEPAGRDAIRAACSTAAGFALEVDGRGARPLSAMTSRDWRDLAGVLRPGESRLEIVRREAPAEVEAQGEEFLNRVGEDLVGLASFYTIACWTLDPASPDGASL